MTQEELFKAHPQEGLFPYWREQLKAWPSEIFYWRHRRETTGWSYSRIGFSFACLLFKARQLSLADFRRWCRFNRRVRRWDRLPDSAVGN